MAESKPRKDESWLKLCEYVHDKIMQYDENIKLSKYMILRLRGLEKGQTVANNKTNKNANYDCDTILTTFKLCRPTIIKAFESKSFENEGHKFNYALSIVDNEINNVVLKLKKIQISEKNVETLKLENQSNESAEYKNKTKKIKRELEELW